MAHPWYQTLQDEPVVKHETILSFILSLVYEFKMKEAHGVTCNSMLKNDVHRQKHNQAGE